jgi:hypothetical protein
MDGRAPGGAVGERFLNRSRGPGSDSFLFFYFSFEERGAKEGSLFLGGVALPVAFDIASTQI